MTMGFNSCLLTLQLQMLELIKTLDYRKVLQ